MAPPNTPRMSRSRRATAIHATVRPGFLDEAANRGILLPDGWFNSGDLGRFDADGYLWITGRAKDIIIRGGHNIDPAVIEETLLKHPDVMLAAAVSMRDS